MDEITNGVALTRRNTLALGGGLFLAAATGGVAEAKSKSQDDGKKAGGELPQKKIEDIIGAKGEMKNGILGIEIGRKDLHVTGHGITFKPSWQVLHEFYMQAGGDGKAIMNGDMALVADELNPVIDQILKQGLVFQAEHQHFYGLSPQIWHIHLRGHDDPEKLAHAIRAVVEATDAPLPQQPPKNPKTPLDADKLGKIIGGDASVGEDGVVHVKVPRKETITLGGHKIIPLLNVETHVDFMPLEDSSSGKARAAVAPDFAMTTDEIGPVMKVMRDGGFDVHCLYNQETGEKPQLFFSHQLAIGDPEELAHVVRRALKKTNSKLSS